MDSMAMRVGTLSRLRRGQSAFRGEARTRAILTVLVESRRLAFRPIGKALTGPDHPLHQRAPAERSRPNCRRRQRLPNNLNGSPSYSTDPDLIKANVAIAPTTSRVKKTTTATQASIRRVNRRATDA